MDRGGGGGVGRGGGGGRWRREEGRGRERGGGPGENLVSSHSHRPCFARAHAALLRRCSRSRP